MSKMVAEIRHAFVLDGPSNIFGQNRSNNQIEIPSLSVQQKDLGQNWHFNIIQLDDNLTFAARENDVSIGAFAGIQKFRLQPEGSQFAIIRSLL